MVWPGITRRGKMGAMWMGMEKGREVIIIDKYQPPKLSVTVV